MVGPKRIGGQAGAELEALPNMAGPKRIGGPAMSPQNNAPPAKTAPPDPWERVAGALESMAHAIRGLTEAQNNVNEGVAAITAALTGNATAIKKEVDRQHRRNEQIRRLAEEVRNPPAPGAARPRP